MRRLALAVIVLLATALAPVGSSSAAPTGARCQGRLATMVRGPGNDTVYGTKKDDVVVLGAGNDRFYDRKGGNDLICAGPGDDLIRPAAGNDTVLGEAGNDTISVTRGSDLVDGGSGHDKAYLAAAQGLHITVGAKRAASRPGGVRLRRVETIFGSAHGDVFVGSAHADTFYGRGGADTIRTGGGNDHVAASGASRVWTGAGNDTVTAQDKVRVWGGSGHDTLSASAGKPSGSKVAAEATGWWRQGDSDPWAGDQGTDTLLLNAGGDPVIDLSMGLVTLQAAMTFQIFDIENVVGSSGRDTIIGDGGPNDLRGGIGADHILGLGGDDVLTGNGGTDDADGGDGTDTCSAETVVACEG